MIARSLAVLIPALAGACSMSDDSCSAAGGECILGNVICAVPGTQSCPGSGTPGGVFCCLSRVADCGQPAETLYSSCDGGTSACSGTPESPPGSSISNLDASFPTGCTVTFPICNDGTPVECKCQGGSWTCFL